MGKSTIIKSLFRAFDAEPTGELRGWDYEAAVVVDFTVDGVSYSTLRRGDLRALFRHDELLGAATSSLEWNDLFSKVVGFKLQLMDRDERFRPASPSMYFMPFYINQDGSFFGNWDTFKSVKQFDSNAIIHTLEYFAQVRPVRYFELKGQERSAKSRIAELEVESSTLQRTRQKIRRTLRTTSVKLTREGFEREVQELTRRATDLASKQDKLRVEIVESQELASQLGDQIRLSDAALKEHESDFKSIGPEVVAQGLFRCPTCHAEHDASFHTFLDLAEDARELYELRERLKSNLCTVNERLTRLRREAAALKQQYVEVASILSAKKGRLTFEDVVKSYSADAADKALDSEIVQVEKTLSEMSQMLRGVKVDLESVQKEHDAKEPLNKFRESFKRLLAVADVIEFSKVDAWKLNKRPTDSGSPGPRAVVAYYASLWSTIKDESGALPAPLVIDSPNQNAQDPKNLARVMAILAGQTPEKAQVILCAEEPSEAFAADKTVELTSKRSLLRRDQMNAVFPRIQWMLSEATARLGGVTRAVASP